MIRATPLALCAALTLLAGCGERQAVSPTALNNAETEANDDVEALPSDGLAAPEGMALDSESNSGEAEAPVPGNNIGSAGGGNVM